MSRNRYAGGLPPAQVQNVASFHKLLESDDRPAEDDVVIAEAVAAQRAATAEEKEAKSKVILVDVFQLIMYIGLAGLLSVVVVLSRKGQYEYYLQYMIKESVLNSEFDTMDSTLHQDGPASVPPAILLMTCRPRA